MTLHSRHAVYALYGGARYAEQCLRSAESLRATDPNIRIHVFTDEQTAPLLSASSIQEVTALAFDPDPALRIDFALKAKAVAAMAGRRFVFLDVDTYITAPLDGAWELLDRYDVLGTQAVFRRRLRHENPGGADFLSAAPDAFAEINTGVVFISERPAARDLVQAWKALIEAYPASGDQYLFMEALWRSPAALYVLPTEWNCRIYMPQAVDGLVRVLHGYSQDPERLAERLNASIHPRALHFDRTTFTVLETHMRAPGPRD